LQYKVSNIDEKNFGQFLVKFKIARIRKQIKNAWFQEKLKKQYIANRGNLQT
jgi:hypothetical protein